MAKKNNIDWKSLTIGAGAVLIIFLLIGQFGNNADGTCSAHSGDTDMDGMGHMDMDMKRDEFISMRQSIVSEQLMDGKYKCCLEKPCSYCIEKSPGHGEGAECNCLEDIVEGVHPCGECIGEILEGHGNPLLSEYFAKAIAEKVGEEHIDTLKQIIEEKYGMPVEEQV